MERVAEVGDEERLAELDGLPVRVARALVKQGLTTREAVEYWYRVDFPQTGAFRGLGKTG